MAKNKSKRGKKGYQGSKGPLQRVAPIAVIIVGIAAVYFLVSALSGPQPGYALPDMGRGHLNETGLGGGCTPNYNSRPPTSGCHHPSILNYAIYDTPQPDRNLVHNLEHGAVIVTYRRSSVPGEDDLLVSQITDLFEELQDQDSKYCRLILTPTTSAFSVDLVPELRDVARDMKIALTAWTRIDLLEAFDREKIVQFIDAHINNAPESFVNDCR